jgi:hypothetical protein
MSEINFQYGALIRGRPKQSKTQGRAPQVAYAADRLITRQESPAQQGNLAALQHRCAARATLLRACRIYNSFRIHTRPAACGWISS